MTKWFLCQIIRTYSGIKARVFPFLLGAANFTFALQYLAASEYVMPLLSLITNSQCTHPHQNFFTNNIFQNPRIAVAESSCSALSQGYLIWQCMKHCINISVKCMFSDFKKYMYSDFQISTMEKSE